MNNIGYIFIVRRLGKQSKLILSRSDSISNLELNLKIHGPCGPNAHARADLQVFFSLLLIYGDNRDELPRPVDTMLTFSTGDSGCPGIFPLSVGVP